GPTGAGKSSFIEAVACNSSLQISSNRLEGFTQSISTYRVKNVHQAGDPIYLVDVPGFADTKISMMGIVSMLREWAKKTGYISHILYFMPINNPRLPGSHRQVVQMFHGLTGIRSAGHITIVSTMWDCFSGRSAAERAESNFKQLQDEIWKEYIDQKSVIIKFYNTPKSALSTLDRSFRYALDNFHIERMIDGSPRLGYTEFGPNVYEDLQTRIQNLRNYRADIQIEVEE
ncbi:hypothetical protein BJ165DRAFT_1317976, partial [Panaeolus papilionaceus]